MIEKWFEPFELLLPSSEPDGLGGEKTVFLQDVTFSGALSFTSGSEITAGGQPMLKETPVLLHAYDLTLRPGNYVRRVKNGAMYRVTDHSNNMRAPAFSGLRFAQVPVERLVTPC